MTRKLLFCCGLIGLLAFPVRATVAGDESGASPSLNLETADRLALLPLKCLGQEFPNKPGETLASSGEVASPQAMHPVFYGCFDWHSSVHGHWMLVRLLRDFPGLKAGKQVRQVLAASMTAGKVLGEVAYFQRTQETSFERTYGWAWLLKLAEELHRFDDPLARQLERNLAPLTDLIVQRLRAFLPKLVYPVRVGEHANTAFALAFAWDYAVATGQVELQELIGRRARDFFSSDAACPLSWEPGGFDFLSPCLEEADLMRRVLPPQEFASWLARFLPQLRDPTFSLRPGEVSDRADGKLVHLDGLNLSRAWCLEGIAATLPEYGHLRELASRHLRHSLPQVTAGSYEGEHWLASFAVYACSRPGS